MKRRYNLIDKHTGELIDVVSSVQWRKRSDEIFYMGKQSQERAFYRDKTVTKGEHRVYGLMKNSMDFSNCINLTQTDIAHELDMHVADVNKAVNSLIRRGILEKVVNQGRYFTYRMNSDFAQKGNELRRVK